MKRTLMIMIPMIALLLGSGCGPNARYCSNCETAVSQSDTDDHARLIRGRCNVGGREIDCTRQHKACPECRKK